MKHLLLLITLYILTTCSVTRSHQYKSDYDIYIQYKTELIYRQLSK